MPADCLACNSHRLVFIPSEGGRYDMVIDCACNLRVNGVCTCGADPEVITDKAIMEG